MNFCAVYPQISYDILKLIKYTDVWVPQNQKLILEPKLQEIGINQFDGITEKEQENISLRCQSVWYALTLYHVLTNILYFGIFVCLILELLSLVLLSTRLL